MNRIVKVGILALATAGLSLAESWSGHLVAARCTEESYGAESPLVRGLLRRPLDECVWRSNRRWDRAPI